MRIGVDVDLTVVNTGFAWSCWLRESCASYDTSIREDYVRCAVNYNLGSYFTMPDGVDAFEFWRSTSLYQPLPPVIGAVDVLKGLNDCGHEIIFISSIKGNHASAKYYWLKKHFPFMKGCLFTHEKELVCVDAMVDDRANILNKFPNKVKCIRIDTPYKQDEQPTRDIIVARDWYEIERILKEEM